MCIRLATHIECGEVFRDLITPFCECDHVAEEKSFSDALCCDHCTPNPATPEKLSSSSFMSPFMLRDMATWSTTEESARDHGLQKPIVDALKSIRTTATKAKPTKRRTAKSEATAAGIKKEKKRRQRLKKKLRLQNKKQEDQLMELIGAFGL